MTLLPLGAAPAMSVAATRLRRNGEAELSPLLGGRAQLDALDRADRDDHLRGNVLARVWTDSHESVTRLRRQRLDHVTRAVGQLDLDVCLPDTFVLRKLLDPPVDPVDQIVERTCEAGNPKIR
jgi:hypothetical protein